MQRRARVGLDLWPALTHAPGLGRYARELVRALASLPDTPSLWLLDVGPAAAEPAAPGSAEREVELLGAIDELAHGHTVPPELVKPSQLAAALVRLLIRKKLISFEEFLDEFGKK